MPETPPSPSATSASAGADGPAAHTIHPFFRRSLTFADWVDKNDAPKLAALSSSFFGDWHGWNPK
jgi:hypothetical protein